MLLKKALGLLFLLGFGAGLRAEGYQSIAQLMVPDGQEVFGVAEKDGFIFVATDDSNLNVFDARNLDLNVDTPTSETAIKVISLRVRVYGLLRKGDILYAYGTGVEPIDISDPEDPTEVGEVLGVFAQNAEFFENGIVFCGSQVGFISLADPLKPELGPTVGLDTLGFAVTALGDRIYVGDFSYVAPPRIRVYDFADRMNIVPVSSMEVPDVAYDLYTVGGQLVDCEDSGLRLFDLLDPDHPVEVTSLPGSSRNCSAKGDLIFTDVHAVRVGPRSLSLLADLHSTGTPGAGFPHQSAVGREFSLLSFTAYAEVIRTPASFTFPQFVDGNAGDAPNRSRVIVRNDSVERLEGVARFYDGEGNPEPVSVEGSATALVSFAVDPGGVHQVVTESMGNLKSGVVEIRFQQPLAPSITGSLIFELLGRFVSVPASLQRSTSTIFVSHNSSERTGLAVYNPDPAGQCPVGLNLRSPEGESLAQDGVELAALQRRALFLDELPLIGTFLTGQETFTGSLEATACEGREVIVLGLVQRLSDGALFAVAN